GSARGLLLMDAHRLRAPSSDGALLAVPPLAAAGDLLQANIARLARCDVDLQGRRVSRLRPLVRQQVLHQARAFLKAAGIDMNEPVDDRSAERLVVTGHQPGLFHPGVWVKNFAVAALARQSTG